MSIPDRSWQEDAACRQSAAAGVSRTLNCDNENAPGGAGNTLRGLTRSTSTQPKEGLAMQATRICRHCGTEMQRPPKMALSQYRVRQYCNKKCKDADRPDIRSDYLVDISGCWIWQGYIDRNGYGKTYDETRPPGLRLDWAHRVSYRRAKGEIPGGHEVDHVCQNTKCVNPDHLESVTRKEHVRRTFERAGYDQRHEAAASLRRSGYTYGEIAEALDYSGRNSAARAVKAAITKGLVCADDVPPAPRLDDTERDDIRLLYAAGFTQAELGAWYGVDSSHISRICSGKSSGHATRGSDARVGT